ncbi:hypothetical protein ACOI1H_19230 [Loktanella sp. DJP18]|uniref:hypothetical protein n=1 Tax=Loktanella sp. DJP18 TaxID=3409788 RepID=UPI003BB5355E
MTQDQMLPITAPASDVRDFTVTFEFFWASGYVPKALHFRTTRDRLDGEIRRLTGRQMSRNSRGDMCVYDLELVSVVRYKDPCHFSQVPEAKVRVI